MSLRVVSVELWAVGLPGQNRSPFAMLIKNVDRIMDLASNVAAEAEALNTCEVSVGNALGLLGFSVGFTMAVHHRELCSFRSSGDMPLGTSASSRRAIDGKRGLSSQTAASFRCSGRSLAVRRCRRRVRGSCCGDVRCKKSQRCRTAYQRLASAWEV